MLADVGPNGMMTLLATDGVYVGSVPKREPGAPPTAKPFVLMTTATERGLFPSFHRVANENAQQVDIFTDELTTIKLGAIYNRLLYLFDNKYPMIAGFVAYRATRVEWISNFADADGASTHGICVVSPTLRIA